MEAFDEDDDEDVRLDLARNKTRETYSDSSDDERQTKRRKQTLKWLDDEDSFVNPFVKASRSSERDDSSDPFVSATRKDDFVKESVNEESTNDTVNQPKPREEKDPEEDAASAYFRSLLAKGRRGGQVKANVNDTRGNNNGQTMPPEPTNRNYLPAPTTPHEMHLPDTFGRSLPQPSTTAHHKIDANLGKWERHTKGIGMKLLLKMGYKGSGGLQAKGMAAPVAVKLRPQNLGLGYGNFREATSKKRETKKGKSSATETTASFEAPASSLPTVAQVLQRKSWKRKRKQQRQNEQDQALTSPTSPTKVVDMTGPTSTTTAVQLGDELLYNVSQLSGTYESRVHTAQEFIRTHQRHGETLQHDKEKLERELQISVRISKLRRLVHVLDEPSDIHSVFEILREFTPDERQQLQVEESFIPQLLLAWFGPMVDAWDPWDIRATKALLQKVLQTSDPILDDWSKIQHKLLRKLILPKLQRLVESSCDMVRQSEPALQLVDAAESVLRSLESADGDTKEDDSAVLSSQAPSLLMVFQRDLIRGVVYTKLSQALQMWKAHVDEEDHIQDPLHHWLLPWLPHLTTDPKLVPELVQQAKVCTASSLQCLHRNLTSHRGFVDRAWELLKPWKGIFKVDTLHRLVADRVVSRLVPCLEEIAVFGTSFDLVEQWNSLGLLSSVVHQSLIEGVVLPVSTKALQQCLSSGTVSLSEAAATYVTVKQRLQPILDDWIHRCLYTVLRVIQEAKENDSSERPILGRTTFSIVLARRKLEAKRQTLDDLEKVFDPTKNAATNFFVVKASHELSFRQVLEQYAQNRGILLQPLRRNQDGKQIFQFGKFEIYLESDVIHVNQGADWNPISLEVLAQRVQA